MQDAMSKPLRARSVGASEVERGPENGSPQPRLPIAISLHFQGVLGCFDGPLWYHFAQQRAAPARTSSALDPGALSRNRRAASCPRARMDTWRER